MIEDRGGDSQLPLRQHRQPDALLCASRVEDRRGSHRRTERRLQRPVARCCPGVAVSGGVGFEPDGAEVVAGGEVNIGVEGGGEAAQQGMVGSVPPSRSASLACVRGLT